MKRFIFFLLITKSNMLFGQNESTIGVVDYTSILNSFAERDSIQIKINRVQIRYNSELGELEKRYRDLVYKCTNGRYRDSIGTIGCADSINLAYESIILKQSEAEKEMVSLNDAFLEKTRNQINISIQKIAVFKGYLLILDVSEGNIPYYDQRDEITELVKKDLGFK